MQSQVYINQALGKAGTIARENPIDKIPVVAEGSAVVAGGFVFEGTDPERQVIGCSASTSSKTAADIAGVAVFERYQLALAAANGMSIKEGCELAKVRRGYVYVVSTTASVHGYHVCLNPATGDIKAANVSVTAGTGAVTGTVNVTQGTITGTVSDTTVSGDTVGVAAALGSDVAANLGSVSGIPEGYIDTGWIVETGNAAGQPCEIYKI